MAFYTGLQSGLLRQAIYTTARMGLFKVFMDKFREKRGGEAPPLHEKALASLAAGGISSWIANPTDLILVRF